MPTKAKTPTENVSSAADFKAKKGQVVTLPSGLSMRLSSPGMTAFIQSGMVPNSLMATITEAINKGKQPDMTQVNLENQEELNGMLHMIDVVTCRCAVEPRVHSIPEDEDEDRDADLLYVDELDDYDKLFIFQWATGGTTDVERFREELDQQVGAVSDGTVISSPAKPPARAKKRPS